jgi:hypothetical protein
MEGIVCPMEAMESSCVCSGGGWSDGSLWRALESRVPTPLPPICLSIAVINLARNSPQNTFFKELRGQNP